MPHHRPINVRQSKGLQSPSLVEPLEKRTLFSVNFLPAVQLPAGAGPVAIARGDFDGDGKADVVTANYAGSSLSVKLSPRQQHTLAGTVFPPDPCVNTALPFRPIVVTAGDYDGDGKADVVVIAQSTALNSAGQLVGTNKAYFLHGLGDGHFGTPQPLPAGAAIAQPNALTTADFNGDGIADLAVYDAADGSVSIMDGSVRGLVPAVRYQAGGPGGARLATGDFNGDGSVDLVAVGEGGTLNFLFNQGDGLLLPAVHVASGLSRVGAVGVGDFNGDGKADLALGTYYSSVHVYLSAGPSGSGGGGGTGFQLVPAGVNTYNGQVAVLSTGDFNGDGKTDLAVGGPTFLAVQLNTGGGFFASPLMLNPTAGPYPNALVVGDFDGDGSVDVATADTSHNSIDLFFNRAPAPKPITGLAVRNVEGYELTPLAPSAVATFTPSPGAKLTDYSAKISWGDGTTDVGQVAANTDGTFSVVAGHTYSDEGSYPLKVMVTALAVPPAGSLTVSPPVTVTAAGIATIHEELLSDGTVGTPNQQFVSELYRDLLHRQASPQDINALIGLLNVGASRASVVGVITSSTEYRTQTVQALYNQLLHRGPSGNELASGIQLLQAGGTVEGLAASLAGSDEYYQSGGHGNNAAFLDALFTDAQGYPLNAASKAYVLNLLNNNTLTRQAVAKAAFTSGDHYVLVVRGLYQNLLDEQADYSDISLFASQLKQGARDEDVIAAIAGSQEYLDKVLV